MQTLAECAFQYTFNASADLEHHSNLAVLLLSVPHQENYKFFALT